MTMELGAIQILHDNGSAFRRIAFECADRRMPDSASLDDVIKAAQRIEVYVHGPVAAINAALTEGE